LTTEDGIGVPVRRREDRRFLTCRGRYVHDIVRPGQLHALFLRSPHAHGEILAIDKTKAMASHSVAAIFTGADVAADKLNGVPCAWGIVGKDGSPMKEPAHPLLAQGKVRHVGDRWRWSSPTASRPLLMLPSASQSTTASCRQ
jgi:aerobic carbon-monoxide dehydrogenase large subunit